MRSAHEWRRNPHGPARPKLNATSKPNHYEEPWKQDTRGRLSPSMASTPGRSPYRDSGDAGPAKNVNQTISDAQSPIRRVRCHSDGQRRRWVQSLSVRGTVPKVRHVLNLIHWRTIAHIVSISFAIVRPMRAGTPYSSMMKRRTSAVYSDGANSHLPWSVRIHPGGFLTNRSSKTICACDRSCITGSRDLCDAATIRPPARWLHASRTGGASVNAQRASQRRCGATRRGRRDRLQCRLRFHRCARGGRCRLAPRGPA